MNEAIEERLPGNCRQADSGLGRACALLIAVVALALVVIGWVQYAQYGWLGFVAACIAAVVCGLSSLAALILAGRLRNTPHAVSGQLGGTIVRMGPPLVVALVLQSRVESLAKAGVFGSIVAFFLVVLLVETLLLVRLVRSASGPSVRAGSSASAGGGLL